MTAAGTTQQPCDAEKGLLGVFIVDDHLGYRNIASAVVAATPGLTVVGVAASTEEALSAFGDDQPAVGLVLMDVNLGEESGTDLTRLITAARPEAKVLLVSVLQRDELPTDAETCGAFGYLPKGELSPSALEGALAGQYDWRP